MCGYISVWARRAFFGECVCVCARLCLCMLSGALVELLQGIGISHMGLRHEAWYMPQYITVQ